MAILSTPENLHTLSTLKGKRGLAVRRYRQLENDRSTWRSHWMEISDYIAHRRGKFLIEDNQNTRGRVRNNKIIDSTGTQALRTMTAGMMSGMTSPARPWHRRKISGDPDLMDSPEVKEWISNVERVERSILNKSNFYNSVSTVYTELGAFGTAPLYRQKSFDNVIHFRPFTAGEYVIAENFQGEVDTVGRYFTMTVSQVVEKFGLKEGSTKIDWTGISSTTKKLWESNQFDSLVPIIHLIEPRRNEDRDFTRIDQMNMRIRSVYFEYAGDGEEVLFEGGFNKMPIYVPRWDVLSGEVYGRSPGMDSLGDIKQLQHQQKRKAQAIDKMVNPPMVASVNLRGKPSTTLPGGNTYVDPTQGGAGFTPAYQVQPRINEMMIDIQEVQDRIQRGFYADLFAMMINSDRRQMTATEVAERHEEKLVLLGPVLQRLNVELLDPLLDDVFNYALEAGLLPPIPEVLEEQELEVEYISLLAQAQQAVSASSIERTMGFAGNLSAVFPNVVDVLDADFALREYSEVLGNNPKLLKPTEEVEQARAAQAEQAQQQQAMEQAGSMAQGAKVLSETDSQSPNALTDLLGAGTI
tara:strand:- start:8548 stop:10290 length:1743 start_codon:yes stop_codon:yes gene_type:complete